MGIFSDEDINESEMLIENDLSALDEKEKEKIKFEFLRGFEKTWKGVKRHPYLSIMRYLKFPFIFISINFSILGNLKLDLRQHPYEFGEAFGYLVAVLKYKPEEIVSNKDIVDKYVQAINFLKGKPKYYTLIKKRLGQWNSKIKNMFNELSQEQKEAYSYFIKSV